MRQRLYHIIGVCIAAVSFTACIMDSDLCPSATVTGNDRITLDLSSSVMPASRAIEGVEGVVNHLDILIFKTDETLASYERIDVSAETSMVTLSARRSSFEVGEPYSVYILANSTKETGYFESDDFNSLTDLRQLVQEDPDIHMTGLEGLTGVPQAFLMDGVAHLKGGGETDTKVVLNNGVASDNTDLSVTLRRAAAKIVVRMKKGENVSFSDDPTADQAGYYLRNMPYSTPVLAGVTSDPKQMTPASTFSDYFDWKSEAITVTAYAYGHDWNDKDILTEEVRLIVNIPLSYDPDGPDGEKEPEFKGSNYYQIPVSKSKMLERNRYYEVEVTVNAPGGSNPSRPLELSDIGYSVYEWENVTVDVGGETEKPAYLTLNEYDMEMHNMEEDNTTLEFASSSEVTVTIDRVYYIDKFGQEKDLEIINERQNPYEWGENRGSNNRPDWYNRCTIRITPDENITGKIDVYGTVPENKTVRYIEFTVKNKEGIDKKVTVEQYPLEYITNIQSWYSYRDDFKTNNSKPTTYEYKGDGIYGITYNSRNGSYTYHNNFETSWIGGGGDGFWRSKVASRHNSDGSSQINYYYYNNYSSPRIASAESSGNARMYHVRITASSDDYTLGNPRITDGYTDPGADNAQLVSPSFMIASRLGFVNTDAGGVDWAEGYALNVARKHCNEYVEVYKDDNGQNVVFDDWRLPTTAELQIIMKFQGTSSEDADAIDYLLNANYYWSASERVENQKQTSSGTSIRCIRDAYVDETGK